MRHIFRETWSGLRRNVSMTLAVIVTMWVSLALFGFGLLATQQVDLMKGRWYDKIEISVFLCTSVAQGTNCTTGEGTTDAQRAAIQEALESNPEVASVTYESKAEAYADFREAFKNSPILDSVTEETMQDSYRVKLKDPQQYQGVVSAVRSMKGVQTVQDLRAYLDPLFTWLNLLRWGTIGIAGLLLVAAALQITNTIRLAAHSRRREIGIMRLVGASNWYILLPFVLESLAAAVIGIVFACLTIAAVVKFVIIDKAQVSIQSLPWVDWTHAGVAMLWMAVVGVALSVIPTLLTARRYVKV
ncbi:permease-like cell division protein FtsX [Propionicicella superfundia]|uniref:permease-like cell division protein FtsX n=1 Tax=Propionicicella superfundia TaxID=348582 RepID=UPI000425556C|nr:permease-like cell division protein FtsX [Propionicicella superfundia]